MGNLNYLMQHPTDHEFGRRALRHLGFVDEASRWHPTSVEPLLARAE